MPVPAGRLVGHLIVSDKPDVVTPGNNPYIDPGEDNIETFLRKKGNKMCQQFKRTDKKVDFKQNNCLNFRGATLCGSFVGYF